MATPRPPPYHDEPQKDNTPHAADGEGENDDNDNDDDLPDAPLPNPSSSSSGTRTTTAAGTASSSPSASKQGSPQWLTYAIASGGCAAMNGVFAKLTTTTSTQTLATSLAHLLGLSHAPGVVEVALRGIFFTLNLLSNATMWFLFTRALTLATSTTRVAVLNTSANFLATAVLGMLVFAEGLPLLWWCGAALLVTGSVVIGRRDEGVPLKSSETGVDGGEGVVLSGGINSGGGSGGKGDVGFEGMAEGGFRDDQGGAGKVDRRKKEGGQATFEAYTDGGLNDEGVWGEERSK